MPRYVEPAAEGLPASRGCLRPISAGSSHRPCAQPIGVERHV
jgi:hypothetical protein